MNNKWSSSDWKKVKSIIFGRLDIEIAKYVMLCKEINSIANQNINTKVTETSCKGIRFCLLQYFYWCQLNKLSAVGNVGTVHTKFEPSKEAWLVYSIRQSHFHYDVYVVWYYSFQNNTSCSNSLIGHVIWLSADAEGKPLSPFHDIPLYADPENKICNMVVEIPRWTNHKMEVTKFIFVFILNLHLIKCEISDRDPVAKTDNGDWSQISSLWLVS
jgi:hypothetical protein